jgi:ABC-type bacteriocin/lantibiotic exporter with double-glycine peptidase domain
MIAFFKQWKFALILCCIVPTIMVIFGIGGTFMTKYAQRSIAAHADASTLAEEIISSSVLLKHSEHKRNYPICTTTVSRLLKGRTTNNNSLVQS